jgi:hypothetical protein
MTVVRQFRLGSKAARQLVAMHRSGVSRFQAAVEASILTKIVLEMSSSSSFSSSNNNNNNQPGSSGGSSKKNQLRQELTMLIDEIPGLLLAVVDRHQRVIEAEVELFNRRSGSSGDDAPDTAAFLAVVSEQRAGAQLLGSFHGPKMCVVLVRENMLFFFCFSQYPQKNPPFAAPAPAPPPPPPPLSPVCTRSPSSLRSAPTTRAIKISFFLSFVFWRWWWWWEVVTILQYSQKKDV